MEGWIDELGSAERLEGVESWVALKDLKESNPVELAEYAVNRKLVSEPAFAWRVPHTLKRASRPYHQGEQVTIHREIAQARHRVAEDSERSTPWRLTEKRVRRIGMTQFCKQIKPCLKPAFRVLELDENIPVGSQHVP